MSKELGVLNPTNTSLGFRDAFHVPAVLVSTVEVDLKPGQPIYFTSGYCNYVTANVKKSIFYGAPDDEGEEIPLVREGFDAIVDPFLTVPITKKDKFWVFVMPTRVEQFSHTFEIAGGVPLIDIEAAKVDSCWKCYS